VAVGHCLCHQRPAADTAAPRDIRKAGNVVVDKAA
jgi:hypothetical protein